jgi:hypothetical protein
LSFCLSSSSSFSFFVLAASSMILVKRHTRVSTNSRPSLRSPHTNPGLYGEGEDNTTGETCAMK